MLEFLLGYCLGRSENSEPEHPRYFREPKTREPTKEENRAGAIFFVILVAIMLGALIVAQDISYRLLDVLRALP